MKSFWRLALAAALALTLGASTASADTISYFLDNPNAALSGFPGPYAEVTVNRTDSTHATITFDSLTSSNPGPSPGPPYLYLMGNGSSAAVNVNITGTGFTQTFVSEANNQNPTGGFTPSFKQFNTGSQNVDDQGHFNLTLDNNDGYGSSATQIVFTLTNTGGTWSSAANVLLGNEDGNVAASHIFPATDPATAGNNVYGVSTGFAGGHTVVPEPGPLLGMGVVTLIGLGYTWRRRRQATA